jgi:hypothetical protein
MSLPWLREGVSVSLGVNMLLIEHVVPTYLAIISERSLQFYLLNDTKYSVRGTKGSKLKSVSLLFFCM